MVNVTWNDATAFCAWLSKKEGKVYELPTEAEWEYACRAGTKTRFWCGDTDASLKGNANLADASLKGKMDADFVKDWPFVSWDDDYPFTSPVGGFKANPWGLYDMGGNVWQWCADGHDKYQEGYIKDPKGKESVNNRVLRGGSWMEGSRNCRSASRLFLPAYRLHCLGFRVVLRSPAGERPQVGDVSGTVPPTAAPPPAAADGFVSLFNGKDLTGWSVDSGAAERWKVEQGQIKGTGIGSADRGWLLSDKEYENFVLTLEFQVAAEADGAVGIRARSGEMEGGLPHHLAIKLTGYTSPAMPRIGAFYYWPNVWQQPSKQAEVAPKGEWNRLTVQVQGDELQVSVNGQEVQNLSLGELAKKANVFPGARRSSGRIGLQQHTGEIRFRKIEIKELTSAKTAPAPEQPVPAPPADPFQPKSVWVDDGRSKTLTVMERKGEMFRAQLCDR